MCVPPKRAGSMSQPKRVVLKISWILLGFSLITVETKQKDPPSNEKLEERNHLGSPKPFSWKAGLF